jgi:ankyrin repeat protein
MKKKLLCVFCLMVFCSSLARADIRNLWNPSKIHQAVLDNDPVAVVIQINENPEVINSQQWNRGMTPLMLAAKNGYTDIAVILLKAGANQNLRSRSKNTALHYAAIYRHADSYHLLVLYGASQDKLNCHYQSSRMIAISNGWQDIIAGL